MISIRNSIYGEDTSIHVHIKMFINNMIQKSVFCRVQLWSSTHLQFRRKHSIKKFFKCFISKVCSFYMYYHRAISTVFILSFWQQLFIYLLNFLNSTVGLICVNLLIDFDASNANGQSVMSRRLQLVVTTFI